MRPREPSPKLVLASQSPRRKELFALTGLAFSQEGAQLDESPRNGDSPAQHALRLAREKAEAVAQLHRGGTLVLGADTIVVHNDTILGKPTDADDAERMLRELQSGIHTVVTAIALAASGHSRQECCSTQVQLRRFSHRERGDYIATGDPLDKAGAYAIQNRQFRPATALGGCFANVMGLPLCHVARALTASGVTLPADIAGACTAHTGYDCPIHQEILTD
ncbi:MAG: Maf family protein [Anaerolineales bacterium]|nr:Maf family protein [Anaerolineales bacterium]HJO32718.1 Maf family protein [Anaerolineales bacterium]